jgi:hypothetical protein
MLGVPRELHSIAVRGRRTTWRETAAGSSILEFFSWFFFWEEIEKNLIGEGKEDFGAICKIKAC